MSSFIDELLYEICDLVSKKVYTFDAEYINEIMLNHNIDSSRYVFFKIMDEMINRKLTIDYKFNRTKIISYIRILKLKNIINE